MEILVQKIEEGFGKFLNVGMYPKYERLKLLIKQKRRYFQSDVIIKFYKKETGNGKRMFEYLYFLRFLINFNFTFNFMMYNIANSTTVIYPISIIISFLNKT